jgi:hypothetical protein
MNYRRIMWQSRERQRVVTEDFDRNGYGHRFGPEFSQLNPLSQLSSAKVYHHAACPMESAMSLADWSTKLTVLGET